MKDRIFVRKYDYMLPWTLFRSNRKSIQSGKIRNSCQCKLKDFCATNCMSVRRRKSIKKHCIFDGKSCFLTHLGECWKRKVADFFGIKQQQRKTCDGHFGARCQKVMSRTIRSRVGLDSPPALSATTTPGPDPPTIYSHPNLSGGHQQIVNSHEMWQTKYFKTRYREIAIFNSKFNWYLQRLVFSVNLFFLAKKKSKQA